MEITKRQWNNIHKKLNTLENSINYIKDNLPKKEKKYLKFEECIPPVSICKDVNSMISGVSNYIGFIGRLSDYYSCEPMGLYIDKTINPKYIAEYRPTLKSAYSRKTTCDIKDVLHEYFHHLVNLNVVVVNKKKEEHYADKYAKLFMERI